MRKFTAKRTDIPQSYQVKSNVETVANHDESNCFGLYVVSIVSGCMLF